MPKIKPCNEFPVGFSLTKHAACCLGHGIVYVGSGVFDYSVDLFAVWKASMPH